MVKSFSTYDEMIAILASRGLETDAETKTILKREGYYRIVNGYKDIFLDPESTVERFLSGTQFSSLYNLYRFDRELRNAFFKRILMVEDTLKSVISYRACDYYVNNQEFYLDAATYTTDQYRVVSVSKTIDTMKNARNSSVPSARHYRSRHGAVPLWVIIKDITLGSLSYFYDLLGDKTLQDRIARDLRSLYELNYNRDLKSFTISGVKRDLRLLTDFRNVCAHSERFYCHTLEKIRTTPESGANVASLFYALRKYLSAAEGSNLMNELSAVVNTFAGSSSFSREVVTPFLKTLGFDVLNPNDSEK